MFQTFKQALRSGKYLALATLAATQIAVGKSQAATVPFIKPRGGAESSETIDQSYFESVVNNVLNIIAFIAGALALFYLIWSGIQYITAGGDTKKADAARQGILHAVIGIIVIIAAYLIINFAIGLGAVVTNENPTSS